MLHTETVEAETLALIKRLSNDPAFKEFNLVGGTALSLQLGHRKSIDIDLFSAKPFDAKAMGDYLKDHYQGSEVQSIGNAVFSRLQGVKVDLITHEYPWIDPVNEIEGIRMVSAKEIGAMKMHAIANSGTRPKDFFDIHFLLEKYSLDELTNAYSTKYSDGNPSIARNALLYHEQINFDTNVNLMTGKLSWFVVARRLRTAVIDPQRVFPATRLAGCNENSTAARTYGRYFHFLNYLKLKQFELIAARSNYRDANGQLIPEKLTQSDVQQRIMQENRAQYATLPLDKQWDLYQAVLLTYVNRKKNYMSTGGRDHDKILEYDAEIEAAKLELGRIERAKSAQQPLSKQQSKREPEYKPKPVFKEEVRQKGFEILKDYFDLAQQPELQRILTTGDDTPEKLHFRGNAIVLLDFFKRLQNAQLAISPHKSFLQTWIVRNFSFGSEPGPKAIRPEYAERVISGREEAVKGKRLIEIVEEGGCPKIRQLIRSGFA